MAEATRVVATFQTAAEAHVAQVRLQAEGIESVVSGDVPNPAGFSLFGRLQYSAIELSVGVSDLARAQEILATPLAEDELDTSWEAAAESAVEGWICAGCDTEVPADQQVCPECGTLQSAQRQEEDEEDED
jgi:hypothetical protein